MTPQRLAGAAHVLAEGRYPHQEAQAGRVAGRQSLDPIFIGEAASFICHLKK